MPDNFIGINMTNRLGSQLVNLAGSLVLDRARLAQVKSDMDQMTDGTTFSTIESTYGIPAGKGQSVYNLVVGAANQLAAAGFVSDLAGFLGASF